MWENQNKLKEIENISIAQYIDQLKVKCGAKFSHRQNNNGNDHWNSHYVGRKFSELEKPVKDICQPSEFFEPSTNIIDLTSRSDGLESIPIINVEEFDKWNICFRSFSNGSEFFAINEHPKCGHKFHKKCIKDYINKKCTKIFGRRVMRWAY